MRIRCFSHYQLNIVECTSARFIIHHSKILEPLHKAARSADSLMKTVASLPLGPEAVHVAAAGKRSGSEQTGAYGHPELPHTSLVASGAPLLRPRLSARAFLFECLLRSPHLKRARSDLREQCR